MEKYTFFELEHFKKIAVIPPPLETLIFGHPCSTNFLAQLDHSKKELGICNILLNFSGTPHPHTPPFDRPVKN